MDQNRPLEAKTDHVGPFWSCECENPVRNKGILAIVDQFGPVHFPTVLRRLLISDFEKSLLVLLVSLSVSACYGSVCTPATPGRESLIRFPFKEVTKEVSWGMAIGPKIEVEFGTQGPPPNSGKHTLKGWWLRCNSLMWLPTS